MTNKYAWDDITWCLRQRAEDVLERIRSGDNHIDDVDTLARCVNALAMDRIALSLKIISQTLCARQPSEPAISSAWANNSKRRKS